MDKRKALFITFEGIEGSGKSTHAARAAEFLRSLGLRVLHVREPGSTKLGEQLRAILLRAAYDIPPLVELFLYEAARAQLLHEVIIPQYSRYDCIICDRFQDATLVYQGYAGGVALDFVKKTGDFVIRAARPDMTIVLDIPVSASMRRMKKNPDRIEQKKLAFHNALRYGYLTIARKEQERVKVVDSRASHARVAAHVRALLIDCLIRHGR